jgi:hypothetical protein
MKSSEQQLFEAEMVRGAAWACMASITLSVHRAARELGMAWNAAAANMAALGAALNKSLNERK